MKKPAFAALVALGVLAFAALLLGGWIISVNNQLVSLDEGTREKWSQVENVYQRRADLIPNLVNTVKGYAKHEATVLEEVTRARSQVGQIKVEKPGDLAQFEKTQTQLTSALSRLMVVVEKYPELKADKNFLELQSQLEGTENRISVERMRFNEAAKMYNILVRKFPHAIIASMRGFAEKAYFTSEPSAKTAPKVEF
ncbi:MAG: LemA family protein [Bdellovibrionales bacterium RIFOXYC1_FULL_54_43]|nr:MAG: LemA family protein [Bdellovibrionales bacterium RIFOXYC1_FULL_54_43]OFZ80681.1 MAG: LemA family protein [Bdellovibrionales bacterium RIFOXYD1_FULL_55_31]